jgi:hypothetical protein
MTETDGAAPISLAQQIEACAFLSGWVQAGPHKVDSDMDTLCAKLDAAAATLRALAAPPSDEDVRKRVEFLRTCHPISGRDFESADLLERLARQLAAKDAPPSNGLVNKITAALDDPVQDGRVLRLLLESARDRIVAQDEALKRAMWYAEQDDKENEVLHERIAALEQQLAALPEPEGVYEVVGVLENMQRVIDGHIQEPYAIVSLMRAARTLLAAAQSQEPSKP